MEIVEDGHFPHSAHFYSVLYADLNVGFIEKGKDDECSINVDGWDITVNDGGVILDNNLYPFYEDTVTASSSDSDYRRYDLLYIDENRDLQLEEGTPSEEPTHPIVPHPSQQPVVILAVLRVEAGASQISELKDCRMIKDRRAKNPHANGSHDPDFTSLNKFDRHGNEYHSEETEIEYIAGGTKTISSGSSISITVDEQPVSVSIRLREDDVSVSVGWYLAGNDTDGKMDVVFEERSGGGDARISYEIWTIKSYARTQE